MGFILGLPTGFFLGLGSKRPPVPIEEYGWIFAIAGKTHYHGLWEDDSVWIDEFVWYD